MFLENGYAYIYQPPTPNVTLDFGTEDHTNFSINYYRNKPLNRFQIWMFKVCFGIKARNTKGESITWTS